MATFHPAVAAWFRDAFGAPSPPQALGWPAIASGKNVLILAPTGSGKTLAAFLQCLSWLFDQAAAGNNIDAGVRVLYISPLKALDNDIHRNLEAPLDGIKETASRLGIQLPRLKSAVRTGDTPPKERERMLRHPPHILITTPESLFLMLCSKARDILSTVRFVIIDEIHALFPTKRGAHLSLSLEHLEALVHSRGRPSPQRIGLSATLRPLDEVARFLGGGTLSLSPAHAPSPAQLIWMPRPVEIIDTGQRKELDLLVEVPVESLRELPERTIWPEIYRHLTNLVLQHRSTLVFVNNRAAAERIAANINDLAGEDIARVHHGSVSREVRHEVEALLKAGCIRCLVATSSLELGIDIGSIDLVVQVESPHEVARGLQRVGRAGHLVGFPSKGRIVVKTRQDLLEAAVIAREMKAGRIEKCRAPRNCLDVLAQHLVGFAAAEPILVDELFRLVRQAYGYSDLPREEFESVLAMVSGLFGPDEFIEFKPRAFWDRVNGRVSASETGRRLVYTSGGTIPDRGYFGVYLSGSKVRLGELDEEFVFERRIGDRFVLGTSVWQVEEIRQDRVIVSTAKGAPTVPFWRGEGFGRPYELGVVLGRFLKEVEGRLDDPDLLGWLGRECLMSDAAARNLRDFLISQKKATEGLPSHDRIIIEEFQDELGEWRVVVHSIFGRRVNEPLGLLLLDHLKAAYGLCMEVVTADDGLIFLCPAVKEPPVIDPRELELPGIEGRLAHLVRTTPLFGLLFRHNAARSLVLPRFPHGGKRAPLWLSRLKAADLLQIVDRRPSFPVVTETYREIMKDVFDVKGLCEVLTKLQDGTIAVSRVRRRGPSPFACPLVFGLMASYMYEADVPKAERVVQSLSASREALKRILGRDELRKMLDEESIKRAEATARRLDSIRHLKSPDELHSWLLKVGEWIPARDRLGDVGDVRHDAGAERPVAVDSQLVDRFMSDLEVSGRTVQVSWTDVGATRTVEAWVARENLEDYLTAFAGRISVRCPRGGSRPAKVTSSPVTDMTISPHRPSISPPWMPPVSRIQAIDRIIRRFAETHGPFRVVDIEARYGFGEAEILESLSRLEAEGFVQSGEFLPGGDGTEWCCTAVLQHIHRLSLARARHEIEPCDPETFARFLISRHGIDRPGAGVQCLVDAIARLDGLPLPAWAWEGGILQARVRDYRPSMLDQLTGSGQVTWVIKRDKDGQDTSHFPRVPNLKIAFRTAYTIPAGPGCPIHPLDPHGGSLELCDARRQVIDALRSRGALFLPQLWQCTDLSPETLMAALEELLVAGCIANDSFDPVRWLVSGRPAGTKMSLVRAGRWFLVQEPQGAQEGAQSQLDPEAMCNTLLDRYGVLTREVAASEGVSWSLLRETLEIWEALGKVRRGYFVRGMSGIQYARPEDVEALRAARSAPPDRPCVRFERFCGLVAQDPANPWGRIIPWPEGLRQAPAPRALVLRDGAPVLVAEGEKARISSMFPLSDEDLAPALAELVKVLSWIHSGSSSGRRRLEIVEWDGEPVISSLGGRAASILSALGFERGPRSMVKWVKAWT
ncbi:MAG TPA: DEAD/DEAH box helicase [Firmicutes bacterium]|nr:DEAD/DEAH box helicase [Bacillota bacterium]